VASLLAGTAPASVAGDNARRTSKIVWRDGSADVWKGMPENEVKIGKFPPADIRRAVVIHQHDFLVVAMRFADLRKVGYQEYWFNLKTPRYHYQAGVFSGPDNRKGRRYFQGDDGSRRCAGFARKLDYGSNVVWMRFPRSCLKNPKWVRIGLLHDFRRKDPQGTPYFDKTSWGESKRLYRGQG
jgi:hypothetical protein